jgi:hypothetical protein
MQLNKIFEQVLKENTDISIIQSKFTELSELFQELCIPFLLTNIDENGIEKLNESEKVELDDKYEQFKVKIKSLARLTQAFFIKSKNPLLDHNFVNQIDSNLYEAINIFENLDKTNQLQIGKIQNAYSAFIMLARLLNTSIKFYNNNYPSNKIAQLHNIPDPQFYEINDYNYTGELMKKSKLFEEIFERSSIRLIEMATRWKPSLDGGKWPMWIKIGSGMHSDGRGEHGIPHAHFEAKSGESGVFSLQNENPPNNFSEVSVIEGEIPTKWKKFIVSWANERSKSYPEHTNWYVARDDWSINRDED